MYVTRKRFRMSTCKNNKYCTYKRIDEQNIETSNKYALEYKNMQDSSYYKIKIVIIWNKNHVIILFSGC